MLTIPFSHRYVKMPVDVGEYRMWPQKTVLLGYRVANKLSPAFIQYDTAIVGGGNFKLPDKGPYLVLFLKTIFYDHQRVEIDRKCWTTVRCPWRRQAKDCNTCRTLRSCRDYDEYDFYHPNGDLDTGRRPPEDAACWEPIIPAKYRGAMGKEVKIVIEERG